MHSVYNRATVMQWNARGIRNKLPDLKLFLLKYQIPVLAICEAYIKDDFALSGYNVFKSGNSSVSRTVLCVRRDLTAAAVPSPQIPSVDYVGCKIRLGNHELTVVSIYIPPSAPLPQQSIRDIFRDLQPPFLVAGDINAHNTLWGSRRTDSRGKAWWDVVDTLKLSLLNDGSPTFLRRDYTTDVLDVSICSPDVSRTFSWAPDVDARGSDHLPTYLAWDRYASKPSGKRVTLTNWAAFRACCNDSFHRGMEADQVAATLSRCFQSSSRVVRVPTGHIGTNPHVEQLRACRRRAERKARRSGDLGDIRLARRTTRLVQKQLKKLDRQRWRQFCASLSPFLSTSKVWNVARSLKDTPPPRNPLGILAVSLGKSELDVASDFCNVITATSNAATSDLFRASASLARDELARHAMADNPVMNMDFSLAELKVALRSSRARSSPGSDGVTYRAVRNLGDSSLSCLLQVFNSSWRRGCVPECWKEAAVVPLLKPGKHASHLSSFRPVSLSSCLGKLLERMVLHRLEWWLEGHHVFPDEMAGFRRHRSSMDAVLDLVTTVEQAKSRRRIVMAVFLDVKRAYDTVSHTHVLHALMQAGVPGRPFRWLADFLRGRTLSIRTQRGTTPKVVLSHGVPQGSVLSPILFNLVMVGLKARIPSKVFISIYADDVCLWTVGKSRPAMRQRLQHSLNSVEQYFTEVGMDLSAEKTAVVAFTRKDMSRHTLSLAGTPLMQAKSHRFLGVILDANLSWRKHIDHLEAKCLRWGSVLRHFAGAKWGMDERSLIALHRALVRGSLVYSLPVLHGLSQAQEQRLRCILARSLRICLGVPRGADTRMVIAEARELPIETLRWKETLRHYLRLVAHHRRHPLVAKIRRRKGCRLHQCFANPGTAIPPFCSKPVVPAVAQWSLPVPSVTLTIPGIRTKKSELPTVALKQLSLDMIYSRYAGHTAVYTDGSTTSSGSSAAFFIPTGDLSHCCRLSHCTSSASAELYAILLFLRKAIAFTPRPWVLLSDSKAALESVALIGLRGSLAPAVVDVLLCLQRLQRRGHSISFQWVPGHCDLPGNDRADELAAAAHRSPRCMPNILTKGDRRLFLSMAARPLALLHWRRDITDRSLLYSVDPLLTFAIPGRWPRPFTTLLHRLRLNVAFTPQLRHRLGYAGSAACPECGVIATIQHLFVDCPVFDTERQLLVSKLRRVTGEPYSLRIILGPCQNAAHHRQRLLPLLDFVTSTGLLNSL